MLENCGFRLRGLSAELGAFCKDDLVKFLSKQPEIRTFSPGVWTMERLSESSFPDGLLPNLSTWNLPDPSMMTSFPRRPIEHLSIHVQTFGPSDIEQLNRFKDTLTCLMVQSKFPMREDIASIVVQVPNLMFLNYCTTLSPLAVRAHLFSLCSTRPYGYIQIFDESLLPSLTKLQELETLVSGFVPSSRCARRRKTQNAFLVRAARMFMSACPRLRHVLITEANGRARRFASKSNGGKELEGVEGYNFMDPIRWWTTPYEQSSGATNLGSVAPADYL
jgi:hypothetical protein